MLLRSNGYKFSFTNTAIDFLFALKDLVAISVLSFFPRAFENIYESFPAFSQVSFGGERLAFSFKMDFAMLLR